MASRLEVEDFLKQLKEKIRFVDIRFRPRDKNLQALADLEITANKRLEYIINLKTEDYYAGPKNDTYDTTLPSYYEFGIQVNRIEVYIKISKGLKDRTGGLHVISSSRISYDLPTKNSMNMKKKIECPYCDGMANLLREAKELMYRKDVFKIVAHFYKCEKCKEEFTTTEADTISLTQAHNQYREKNNIPFPEEIAAIRQKYDLPASKMSEVLGLGANGYSNYENGEIPTPAYGNLISAASEPHTFLNLLDKAKEHFSENAFKKVRGRVTYLIQTTDRTKDLCANFNVFNEANNYTGYRKPIPNKIANLVTYFIQHSKPDFNDKLKLNKQLFFTDFTHYKNYGSSISGLSYRAIKYGPVPANYDNIYAYLENEQLISAQFLKLPNGGAREVFVSEGDFDKNLFTEEEKKTITAIIEKFANISTWDIVDLSHKEKAWKELEANKKLIGYQDYAFELKAI